jgi:hypothetical protein
MGKISKHQRITVLKDWTDEIKKSLELKKTNRDQKAHEKIVLINEKIQG